MAEPQLWVSALEIGSFYGLLALGFSIIFQGSRVFNFSVGAYAMVGGLAAAWAVAMGQSPIVALVFGVVLGAGSSILTEILVVRPIVRRGTEHELPMLIAVAATLFALEQAAGVAFGRSNRAGPTIIRMEGFEFDSVYLSGPTVQLFVFTAVVFIGVAIWLQVSTTGRLLRAVGDNPAAATVLGFPIARIRFVAFALAGAIVAVAGIIFASKAGISFRSSLPWALKGFLAVVIGGTGHIFAPLVGGLVLGFVEVFVPFYLGGGAPDYAIFLLAILFFSFRPEGIFMKRVRT